MTCDKVHEWLSAVMDGEAGPPEREAVETHLAACAGCRQEQAAAAALRSELRGAAVSPLDAEARDEQVIMALVGAGIVRQKDLSLDHGALTAGTTASEGGAEQRERMGLLPGRWTPLMAAWGGLRPAAVAMAVAFLVTWGPLRLAETGSLWSGRGPVRDSALGRQVISRLFPSAWHMPPGVLASVLCAERENAGRRSGERDE